jgi:Helicase associated domain
MRDGFHSRFQSSTTPLMGKSLESISHPFQEPGMALNDTSEDTIPKMDRVPMARSKNTITTIMMTRNSFIRIAFCLAWLVVSPSLLVQGSFLQTSPSKTIISSAGLHGRCSTTTTTRTTTTLWGLDGSGVAAVGHCLRHHHRHHSKLVVLNGRTNKSSSDTASSSSNKANHVKWQPFFEQLVVFKAKYGHCNVLQVLEEDTENSTDMKDSLGSLATWYQEQLVCYQKLQENKKTKLTKTRAHALELLGAIPPEYL